MYWMQKVSIMLTVVVVDSVAVVVEFISSVVVRRIGSCVFRRLEKSL